MILPLLKKYYPAIFILSYILYIPLSWILILRDGRISYSILLFYPQLKPWYHSIEPHMVSYGLNSIPTIVFMAIVIATFVCYLISLKLKLSIKKIIVFALIFQAIMFLSYPILSSDIFSYIFSDRMLTVHHENVWKVTPDVHKDDAFIMFAAWEKNTRVYGGVNQAIYTPFSYLGGDNLLVVVILYKLVAWVFALLSMWMVYLTTKKYFKGKEALALQLVYWNPLFLFEILGSGHNDIIMIFFMIGGLYFFLGKKIILSSIFLALAVQVKIIALVLFIYLLFSLLQKRAYKNLLIFPGIFLVINSIIFYFMDVDPMSFGKAILFNTGVYWQGLPAIMHPYFSSEKLIILPLFSLSFFVFVYLVLKNRLNAVEGYVGFIFMYVLFFASAYWNWYALWSFCFIPFLSSQRMKVMLLMLTFSSLFMYPLYWLSLRFAFLHINWAILIYLFFAGTPILFYFVPQKYLDYLLTRS